MTIAIGYIIPAIVLILCYKTLKAAAIDAIEKEPFPFPWSWKGIIIDFMVFTLIFCPILNFWFAIRGIKVKNNEHL